MFMLAALLACGPKPPARVAQPLAVEAPAAPAAELPVPGFDAGANRYPGRGPVGSLEVLWELDLGGPLVTAPRSDGERYLVSSGQGLIAVDRSGEELWRLDTRGPATPRLQDGQLVVLRGDELLHLEPTTGAVLRQEPGAGQAVDAPVELGEHLVWADRAGTVYGPSWDLNPTLSVVGGPSSNGELLLIASEEGELVAVADGQVAWGVGLGGPARFRPAVGEAAVFQTTAAYDGAPGQVLAFDLQGQPLWQRPLAFQAAGPPALAHQRVYLAEAGGLLLALDEADGGQAWELELEHGLSTGLVVAGSRGYVGSARGELLVIDLDDGVVWGRVALGAVPASPPVIAGDQVVVGLVDGRLVAVGPAR